jgi:hypothetical protein
MAEQGLDVSVGDRLEAAREYDSVDDDSADAVEFGAEEEIVVGEFVPVDGGGKKRFEGHCFLSK